MGDWARHMEEGLGNSLKKLWKAHFDLSERVYRLETPGEKAKTISMNLNLVLTSYSLEDLEDALDALTTDAGGLHPPDGALSADLGAAISWEIERRLACKRQNTEAS